MSTTHNTTVQNPNITDVKKIRAMVSELETMLLTQRDLLRQRGMGLPPGTITHINDAQRDIDNISTRLAAEQVELNRLHALTETFALINSSMGLDDVLTDKRIGLPVTVALTALGVDAIQMTGPRKLECLPR